MLIPNTARKTWIFSIIPLSSLLLMPTTKDTSNDRNIKRNKYQIQTYSFHRKQNNILFHYSISHKLPLSKSRKKNIPFPEAKRKITIFSIWTQRFSHRSDIFRTKKKSYSLHFHRFSQNLNKRSRKKEQRNPISFHHEYTVICFYSCPTIYKNNAVGLDDSYQERSHSIFKNAKNKICPFRFETKKKLPEKVCPSVCKLFLFLFIRSFWKGYNIVYSLSLWYQITHI